MVRFYNGQRVKQRNWPLLIVMVTGVATSPFAASSIVNYLSEPVRIDQLDVGRKGPSSGVTFLTDYDGTSEEFIRRVNNRDSLLMELENANSDQVYLIDREGEATSYVESSQFNPRTRVYSVRARKDEELCLREGLEKALEWTYPSSSEITVVYAPQAQGNCEVLDRGDISSILAMSPRSTDKPRINIIHYEPESSAIVSSTY